jgi:hypothetical protein
MEPSFSQTVNKDHCAKKRMLILQRMRKLRHSKAVEIAEVQRWTAKGRRDHMKRMKSNHYVKNCSSTVETDDCIRIRVIRSYLSGGNNITNKVKWHVNLIFLTWMSGTSPRSKVRVGIIRKTENATEWRLRHAKLLLRKSNVLIWKKSENYRVVSVSDLID